MSDEIKCPVCENKFGGTCRIEATDGDYSAFECEICGRFELTGTIFRGVLDSEKSTLTTLQRAALTHWLWKSSDGGKTARVWDDWLTKFLSDARLPTPAAQALNAIRFVGDHYLRTGEKVASLQPSLYAVIGAASPEFAGDLIYELRDRGLVDGIEVKSMGSPPDLLDAKLTLAGWEQYESEQRGSERGGYGFLALKFGDEELDPFVDNVLKPCIKSEFGVDLIDMRDAAQAGLIDNIMREKIRDADFVIVDLTHDNPGAYWESGFAEGLGKAVIYICEKGKFDRDRTHFDTNHCTTVPWTTDDADGFRKELIATLRQSM